MEIESYKLRQKLWAVVDYCIFICWLLFDDLKLISIFIFYMSSFKRSFPLWWSRHCKRMSGVIGRVRSCHMTKEAQAPPPHYWGQKQLVCCSLPDLLTYFVKMCRSIFKANRSSPLRHPITRHFNYPHPNQNSNVSYCGLKSSAEGCLTLCCLFLSLCGDHLQYVAGKEMRKVCNGTCQSFSGGSGRRSSHLTSVTTKHMWHQRKVTSL